MSKIRVSFIIPVYNGGKYIETCLNNVLNQTIKDFEIICINDGSKDNTLSLMEGFQKKFPEKIRIISQKNSGPWAGRKNGIREARGEYICFLDCDDVIENDYAEVLYNRISLEKADMAVCAFSREDLETGRILSTEMNKFGESSILVSSSEDRIALINTSLWNKIFKSDILKRHPNIDNPPRIAEDAIFLLLLYPSIKKISFTERVLHHYKVHIKSAMSNFSIEEINKIKNSFVDVKKYYMSSKAGKELLPILDLIAFIQLGIAVISRFSFLNNKEYNKLIKSNYSLLNREFRTWSSSKFLGFSYLFKTKFRNIKLYIVKVAYKLGLLLFMLKLYSFVTKKLKIDIKW